MKQKIAIDIDDVIADSTDSFRLVVNQRTGANLTREHYQVPGDYWQYYENVWKTHGIHQQLSSAALYEEMERNQLHIPLLAGAGFAVGELSKRFNIILITARHDAMEAATKEWLRTHFGDTVTEVHFVGSKEGRMNKSKGDACVELGASWLIDDNPEHCLSATELGVTALLFGSYGWHHNAPDSLIKCLDWPAVLDYFNGITQ